MAIGNNVPALHRAETSRGAWRHSRCSGRRRAGKTTLVRKVVKKRHTYLTLDDQTTLDAARTDPSGFVRELDYAAIDEIQRAPGLLLAIKKAIDEDGRPGRFLLTGSANLLTLPRIADSLAGRMEVIHLLPLARAEILGRATHTQLDCIRFRNRKQA